jgi:hypothetical protein
MLRNMTSLNMTNAEHKCIAILNVIWLDVIKYNVIKREQHWTEMHNYVYENGYIGRHNVKQTQ